jgi:Na+-driven multidrug efflux pump
VQKFLEVYIQGFSQATGAMVGQNLGAKKQERAKKVVFSTLGVTVTFAIVMSGVIALIPRYVFRIFTNDDAVLDMGVRYMYIMIPHIFLSACTSSLQAMVIGVGNVTLNFVIGILDGVVCKIGLSMFFAMAMGLGAYGYFWGTALSRFLPGIICLIYFTSGIWRKRKLLVKTEQEE